MNGPKEKEGGAMLKARGRLVVISAAGKDATFVAVAHNPNTALLFTAVHPNVSSSALNFISVGHSLICLHAL